MYGRTSKVRILFCLNTPSFREWGLFMVILIAVYNNICFGCIKNISLRLFFYSPKTMGGNFVRCIQTAIQMKSLQEPLGVSYGIDKQWKQLCEHSCFICSKSLAVYGKHSKILNTRGKPKRQRQTAQIQIRLLLQKQPDLGLPCLLF